MPKFKTPKFKTSKSKTPIPRTYVPPIAGRKSQTLHLPMKCKVLEAHTSGAFKLVLQGEEYHMSILYAPSTCTVQKVDGRTITLNLGFGVVIEIGLPPYDTDRKPQQIPSDLKELENKELNFGDQILMLTANDLKPDRLLSPITYEVRFNPRITGIDYWPEDTRLDSNPILHEVVFLIVHSRSQEEVDKKPPAPVEFDGQPREGMQRFIPQPHF